MGGEVIAAGRRYGVELVVGQPQATARGTERAVKLVVGIFHAVLSKDCFEASFVKRTVVCHEGETLYALCYLSPHLGKGGSVVSIGSRETVDLCSPEGIVVGSGAYEAVEFVYNLASTHHYDAYAAHTRAATIGCLKVDGYEVLHYPLL